MNLEYIDQLIDKMEKSKLTELSYKDSDIDIKLKRESEVQQVVQEPVVQNTPQVAPSLTSNKQDTVTENNNSTTIKAPMVGTFYKSPSPEAEPYVKVGDRVENDTIVCILEAMKLFNEIEADVSGEIVEILVEDGEMVEYNQPMFKVK